MMLVAGRYQSTHALFAKPCNSIGPIVVSLALPNAGSVGHGRNGLGNTTLPAAGGEDRAATDAETETAQICFALMTMVPLVAALLELLAWQSYTLTVLIFKIDLDQREDNCLCCLSGICAKMMNAGRKRGLRRSSRRYRGTT